MEEEKEQTLPANDKEVENNITPTEETTSELDEKSLEEREAELSARERDLNVRELVEQNNLPTSLIKDLADFDFEQSKVVVNILNKYSKQLSQEIAQKKLKENGYSINNEKPSTISKSYGEMSVKERIALKNSNPELYDSLLADYRKI